MTITIQIQQAAPEYESLLAWKNKRTSPNVGKHTLALTDGYEVQGFTIIAGAHDATAQHNMKYRCESTLVYDNSNLCDKPTICKPSDYTHSAPPALTGFTKRRCNVLTSLETSSAKMFQSFSLFLDGI